MFSPLATRSQLPLPRVVLRQASRHVTSRPTLSRTKGVKKMSDSWFTHSSPLETFFGGRLQQSFPSPFFRRSYSQGGATHGTYGSALRATYVLISINLAVFAGWHWAEYKRDRKLTEALYENFTLSWLNWNQGRSWTLLTSAFSHIAIGHIFFNMFALRTFGTMLSWVPGVGAIHMLVLSAGSGLAGSVAWLYQKKNSARQVQDKRWGVFAQSNGGRVREVALGASGLVMGAGAAAACLMPFAPMSLMFIPIPIPLWALTGLYAAVDTYFLHSNATGIGHSAHLGGALFGVVYYFAFLRRFGGIWKLVSGRR